MKVSKKQLKNIKAVYPFGFVFLALLCATLLMDKFTWTLLINGSHSSFWDHFFLNITWLGEGFLIACAGIMALFSKIRWFLIFLIALILHLVFINFGKHFLFSEALRPLEFFERLGKEQLLYLVEGLKVHRYHSFPSGHTTGATFAAAFFAIYSREYFSSFFWAVIALLVGISRVYLGQHFLTDITAGYFLGIFSVLLSSQLVYSLVDKKWSRAHILPYPTKLIKFWNINYFIPFVKKQKSTLLSIIFKP